MIIAIFVENCKFAGSYHNTTDAARATNTHRTNISKLLNGRRNEYSTRLNYLNGFYFVKLDLPFITADNFPDELKRKVELLAKQAQNDNNKTFNDWFNHHLRKNNKKELSLKENTILL